MTLTERLRACPPIRTVPHYICPNPNNAGKDTDLVDAAATVAGGVLANFHSDTGIEFALGVQARTSCKVGLALMDFGGLTFDEAGLKTVDERLSTLKRKYPALSPSLLWVHNESQTADLLFLTTLYATCKSSYPAAAVVFYGSGISIGQGATGRRSIFPAILPRDGNSFDLYEEDTRLMREVIAKNVAEGDGLPSWPTVTLYGAYTMTGKTRSSPIVWDRSFRYTPEVQRARAFMVLSRSLRDCPLGGVVFYPFGPDKPEELEAFGEGLVSYAVGWNSQDVEPPAVTPEEPPEDPPAEDSEDPGDPEPPADGDPQDPPVPGEVPQETSSSLTPVARWVVPEPAFPGPAGILAFSRDGIYGVEFQTVDINGVKSAYTITQVTAPNNNGLEGYWTDARDGDTITATVIGADGGRRELPARHFKAESGKTVRVEVGGSIRNAIRDVGPGGTVLLAPGKHVYDAAWYSLDVAEADHWVTVDGEGQATISDAPRGSLLHPMIRFKGCTITAQNLLNQKGSDTRKRAVWFDGCDLYGTAQKTHVVGGAWLGPVHYTNCNLHGFYRGQGLANYDKENSVNVWVLFDDVQEDTFQNMPFGAHIRVTKSDPGSTGDHADIIQGWGGSYENWLWYKVEAEECHYQGIFCRSMGVSRNCAFVGCDITQKAPSRGGAGSAFTGTWDHLLILDSEFQGANAPDMNARADLMFWGEGGKPFTATNSVLRNCGVGQLRAFDKLPEGFLQDCTIGTFKEG